MKHPPQRHRLLLKEYPTRAERDLVRILDRQHKAARRARKLSFFSDN